MKKLFFINIIMGISLVNQPTQCLSPQVAAVATGVTTIGIAAATYLLFKNQCKMDRAERLGLTIAVTAPLGYIASALWFGLTPEMRYLFAKKTSENNELCLYAYREYKTVDALLQGVEANYGSYTWLVNLHDDIVRALSNTRSALKKWTMARAEEAVQQYPWVDQGTYDQLLKQRACLEHNLLLLRRYQPFQTQHNAWLSAHNCHYSRCY